MKTLLLLLMSASGLAVPCLSIDRTGVYASADVDEVFEIHIATDNTLTNWVFITNGIGNGHEAEELIDEIGLGSRIYKITPEL